MNDQLQKALADLLAKANQGIDAGSTFLQAQLPDVIQQLLVWKAVYSVLSFVGAMSLAGAVLYLYYRLYRWWMSLSKRGDHPEIMFVLLTAFLWTLVIGMFSLDWLQILIAPKVYLIEYAASLAKGG